MTSQVQASLMTADRTMIAAKLSDGTVRTELAPGKLNTNPMRRAATTVTAWANHIDELLGSGPATEGHPPA